MLLYIISRIKN
ncbi:hypothetical protein D018_4816A, partial [Vibrio parahaemolyticus VP2007-007]